ncbi:MAG: glycosyltransferase family 1 protein [Luteolibacter sp.]
MRIAFDSQIFQGQRHGGISRYFTRTAEELLNLGEDVKVFAPHHVNEYLKKSPPELVANSPVLAAIGSLPYPLRKYFTNADSWPLKLQMRRWNPSIVHETYYQRHTVAPKGTPVILTVLDMIHELFPQHFSASDPTIPRKKESLKRADHIICISTSTQNDLIRLYDVPINKTSVILLASDPPPVQECLNDLPAEAPFLLFVGQRNGYKNFTSFLKAFERSAALKNDFHIIAFGGGQFNPSELETLKSLGLEHRVKQVSGDDLILAGYYASARAFVYPSLYEGFGLPPLEAMARGCPVASSNTSSMPEVIGQAARFFDPTCIESMSKALEDVCYDDQMRQNLIQEGYDRAAQLTWKSCAQQTLEVYRRYA